MQDVTLPKATHDGDLPIAGTVIPCAVLENGQRVLTQDGFLRSIGRLARGGGGQGALADKLPVFLRAQNLQVYISEDIEKASVPIIFRTKRGKQAFGYKAELLPVVCDIFLKAREDDVLTKKQEHIAQACEILVRGLATVGIIALVDEATGYQYERDRQALHKILEAYISKELLPWTKRFPDNYYENLFRLMKWQYSPLSVKRPQLVGKLTNTLIYEQLPPGVLDELKHKNPKNEKGRRKHKFFQFLTDDIGNPHLEKQIVKVVTLMQISRNWRAFKTFFAQAHPGPKQIDMFPEDEN